MFSSLTSPLNSVRPPVVKAIPRRLTVPAKLESDEVNTFPRRFTIPPPVSRSPPIPTVLVPTVEAKVFVPAPLIANTPVPPTAPAKLYKALPATVAVPVPTVPPANSTWLTAVKVLPAKVTPPAKSAPSLRLTFPEKPVAALPVWEMEARFMVLLKLLLPVPPSVRARPAPVTVPVMS